MKINKKGFRFLPLAGLGFAAMLVAVQPITAQPHADAPRSERREGRRGGHMKMFEQLNLTDDQKAALKPVFENMRTETKALREDQNLTREQRREQMKQIRTESDTKINAILTDEQRSKLAELRSQQKANRRERRNRNKAEQGIGA